MGAYSYQALNAEGKLVKGVIEGDSERQVRSQLRAKQLKPVDISSASGKKQRSKKSDNVDSKKSSWAARRVSMSTRELAMLTRQLSTLIQSGMPLDEALNATAQQSRKAKIKSLVLQVRTRVLEGHSLAYALGDFPGVFDEMYCSMVKAGESAGFLGQVLERLADYTETSQYTQQKLQMAMIYPIILMLVAVGVIALLMIFVVPELTGLFAHRDAELPFLTKLLISCSDFLTNYGLYALGVIILMVFGIRMAFRKKAVRKVWDRFILKVPFFSDFVTAVDTARFASTLSILVSSGVPLLQGLKIAGAVLKNLSLRKASEQVAISVQEGMSLNKALNETGVFPPMMVHMVASGEASGELENMLARSAANQERDLEMTLGTVMGVLEPLMVVIMASVVGVIVVAILMPIIEMNNLVA